MSFKTKVLPYFRHWTKTAVVAAAQTITDIANLWGYWRSDTGVNGKLAVDLANTIGSAQVDYLSNTSHNIDGSVVSAHIVCDSDDWSNATKQILFTINDGSTANEIEVSTASGTMSVKATLGSTTTTATYTHTYSGFNHILVSVTENSATGIKIYSNGSEVTYGGSQDTTGDTFSATMTTVYEGGSNLSTSNPLDGAIDQFVIANGYDLTADASTFYGDSGVGIKFGDLVGTEGFYNYVIASGGGCWVDHDSPKNFGRESSQETHAVYLSGTVNDYFSSTSSDFNFGGSAFSIGAWVKLDDNSTIDTFIGKIISETIGNRCFGIFFANGKPSLSIYDSSNNQIAKRYDVDIGTGWNHVFWTYNGNGTDYTNITIYVNGVDVGGIDLDSGIFGGWNEVETFEIGKNRISGLSNFSGKVDQVQVYNAAIDPTPTGLDLHNSGVPLNYADLSAAQKTNLVSHWDFNEQDHTIIGQDSHTNLNHLTPNNIGELDLVGGKDSLDLTENGIDSSNAVAGVVVGQVINQENVFSWTDLSGNSNDLEQSTIANQPLFDENKGIRFTGSKFLITSGNAGIATDFTVFMVGQFTDITEATALLKTSADLISKDTSGKIKNDFATTPNASTTALVNDTNKIFAVRLEDGVAGDYWFDGTQGDSITDTTNNTTDAALRLINTTLTGTAFIDSVVVYQRSLTDAEMADVFTDLNNRFSVY